MRIAIDASNIRTGGGVTHLKNILEEVQPKEHFIERVIVWGGNTPLDNLPSKPWLELCNISCLNKSLPQRLLWQQTKLRELALENCDLLFVPGGLYLGGFRPYVSMFQNMQIFESKERLREGISSKWLRLQLLMFAQSHTFQNASGLICLSEYSWNYLTQFYPHLTSQKIIKLIPHGSSNLGVNYSATQNKQFLKEENFRILYVSTVKKYKHQWNLIDAVGELRKEGIILELHLVGGADSKALGKMYEAIYRNKADKEYIYYHGNLPYEETLKWYNKANLFVFASTCESFGISLVEAMSAGLPVASSDRGPMPEVLKDSGLYFNPESIPSIKRCLRHLIKSPNLMKTLAGKAKKYSQSYSWKKCAYETFAFLRSVYEKDRTD